MVLLLAHRRGVCGGQCQGRVAERFPVAVPCTGDRPGTLRHDLTAPGPHPTQTVWRYGERYEPDTLDPRLGMEPLPEDLGRLRIVPVVENNRPASVINTARAAIASPTMPLERMQPVQIRRTSPLPGWPAWGPPGLPVLTPLPAEEGDGELGLERRP